MYDMKKLARLKKLDELAPDAMHQLANFDTTVFREGALSSVHKQLIAVAVALTTQCPYCLEIHAKAARATNNWQKPPSWRLRFAPAEPLLMQRIFLVDDLSRRPKTLASHQTVSLGACLGLS